MTKFSHNLKRNVQQLDAMLHRDTNSDIVARRFRAFGRDAALYYVQGMVNTGHVGDLVLRPLMHAQGEVPPSEAIRTATERCIAATDVKTEREVPAAADALMKGLSLLMLDGAEEAVLIDLRGYVRRGISPSQTENVVIGPHEAFSEALRDNLTLLHKILPTAELICEMEAVGTQISTQVAVCYLRGVCPQQTVQEIKRRIHGSATDFVLTIGMLAQLLEDDPHAPLPQVVGSERPDRAVSFLLEGQAVVLMDGTPRCLAMPMSLWHLFHAPDDSYMRWQYGTFMRVVRMAGALVALLLPALFVSIVIFHPMALPMSLLTNIIQSRSVISISLFGEAMLMLTVFNLINEAGTRIPGLLGSSFGLVSALILGTAAVDAGLVSPLLIIVVALSGLGGFALPNYSLSFAFRIAQMALVVAGGTLGVGGVAAGLVLMVFWVAGMRSLGVPYLAPTAPKRVHNPDLVMHAPVYRQRLRGYLSRSGSMLRSRGRMRRFERRRDE